MVLLVNHLNFSQIYAKGAFLLIFGLNLKLKRRSVVLAYPADCFSASIGAMIKVSTVLKSSRRAEFKSGLYLRYIVLDRGGTNV